MYSYENCWPTVKHASRNGYASTHCKLRAMRRCCGVPSFSVGRTCCRIRVERTHRGKTIEESRKVGRTEGVRYGVEQDHQILAPAPLVSSHSRR